MVTTFMPCLLHRITAIRLSFLPVQTRVPLQFAHETLTSTTCARVAMRAVDEGGCEAEGWGETPLSVQWSWPGTLPYEARHNALKQFCLRLASAWMEVPAADHPLELGYRFNEEVLPLVLDEFNHQHARNLSGKDASPVLDLPM